MVGLREFHRFDRGRQVGTRRQGRLTKLFERLQSVPELERAVYIEFVHVRPAVEQLQQLNLAGPECDDRRFMVGLELRTQQFQPVEIDFRQIPRR